MYIPSGVEYIVVTSVGKACVETSGRQAGGTSSSCYAKPNEANWERDFEADEREKFERIMRMGAAVDCLLRSCVRPYTHNTYIHTYMHKQRNRFELAIKAAEIRTQKKARQQSSIGCWREE
uniref:JmjC domain-containing protein n=1 Tax=Ascaris lumbricoides TaxID=6252 RepID=A0A0M3IMC0_ASCLU